MSEKQISFGENAVQQDYFFQPLFRAEDFRGFDLNAAGEGLSGSGNLNFATLFSAVGGSENDDLSFLNDGASVSEAGGANIGLSYRLPIQSENGVGESVDGSGSASRFFQTQIFSDGEQDQTDSSGAAGGAGSSFAAVVSAAPVGGAAIEANALASTNTELADNAEQAPADGEGQPGMDGASGDNGADGSDGESGDDGQDGQNGMDGSGGDTGDTGDTGADGGDGDTGADGNYGAPDGGGDDCGCGDDTPLADTVNGAVDSAATITIAALDVAGDAVSQLTETVQAGLESANTLVTNIAEDGVNLIAETRDVTLESLGELTELALLEGTDLVGSALPAVSDVGGDLGETLANGVSDLAGTDPSDVVDALPTGDIPTDELFDAPKDDLAEGAGEIIDNVTTLGEALVGGNDDSADPIVDVDITLGGEAQSDETDASLLDADIDVLGAGDEDNADDSALIDIEADLVNGDNSDSAIADIDIEVLGGGEEADGAVAEINIDVAADMRDGDDVAVDIGLDVGLDTASLDDALASAEETVAAAEDVLCPEYDQGEGDHDIFNASEVLISDILEDAEEKDTDPCDSDALPEPGGDVTEGLAGLEDALGGEAVGGLFG